MESFLEEQGEGEMAQARLKSWHPSHSLRILSVTAE